MVEQTVYTKQLRAAAPHRAQYKMKLGTQPAEGTLEADLQADARGIKTGYYQGENKKTVRIIWMQTKCGIYLQLEICNY